MSINYKVIGTIKSVKVEDNIVLTINNKHKYEIDIYIECDRKYSNVILMAKSNSCLVELKIADIEQNKYKLEEI